MSDRALCIGKFDALHRGHRALAEAARPWGKPCLLRFSGMAEALGWGARAPLVSPVDRVRILESWQVDEAVLPFSGVRSCDPAAFIALLRRSLHPAALVIGEDFRGGPGRQHAAWEFAAAARLGGMLGIVLPLVQDGPGAISSTRIRAVVEAGDVAAAHALLGRPHRLTGTVVRGDGRGRQIGIPTANVAVEDVLLPAPGVYAAWACMGDLRRPAAVNIGTLPTIAAGRTLSVEAHLLDHDGDLYGRTLSLDLVERLRPEQRFPDLPTLVAHIRADVAAVRERLI